MKVQGPLMSFGASGTIGNMATFATWKGRPYVRQRVTPSNPRSDGQYVVRSMFSFLGKAWGAEPVPPGPWQDLADQGKFSPFNAYQKFNMNQWTQGRPPVIDPADIDPTASAAIPQATLTGGVGQFNLDAADTNDTDPFGLIVLMDTVAIAGFNRALTTDVFITDGTSSGIVNRPVLQVPPGTWHVRVLYFDQDGGYSSLTADDTVIVT